MAMLSGYSLKIARCLPSFIQYFTRTPQAPPLNTLVSSVSKAEGVLSTCTLPCQVTQIRTRYVSWGMLRDVKRRETVKEYAPYRLRIKSVRSCNRMLPREIVEIAQGEWEALPSRSHPWRLNDHCQVTARIRGVIKPHNVSRFVWRHLADYNKLSGVIRAKW